MADSSYTKEQAHRSIDTAYRPNFYGTLDIYNSSLGVPITPGPFPIGMSVLPSFDGVSYINPNYNSLVNPQGSCSNPYPTVTDGYMDKPNNCVTYNKVMRPCSKNAKSVVKPVTSKMFYSEGFTDKGFPSPAKQTKTALNSPYQHDSSCGCAQ